MNRTINRTLGSILLASVAVSNAETKCEPGVQAAHELTLKDDRNGETKLGFLLRTPPATAAKPTNGWPLLIFLHGSGERGTDTAKVKSHGPPSLVGKKPALDQMIVLSPQCPPDRWWDIVALKNLIDSIVLDQHADPKRIYLTGLSMGGYATWDLLAAHPKFFAAAVPICGGGDPTKASAFARVPIWNFHGTKDTAVPIAKSEEMIAALTAAGGTPKFTVYPEEAHQSWIPAYKSPELWIWLLAQSR